MILSASLLLDAGTEEPGQWLLPCVPAEFIAEPI